MTDHQLVAPMPDATLISGCTVTFEAINPDTGVAVTGVTISSATLHGVNAVPADTVTPPADDVLPYFVPIPVDEAA